MSIIHPTLEKQFLIHLSPFLVLTQHFRPLNTKLGPILTVGDKHLKNLSLFSPQPNTHVSAANSRVMTLSSSYWINVKNLWPLHVNLFIHFLWPLHPTQGHGRGGGAYLSCHWVGDGGHSGGDVHPSQTVSSLGVTFPFCAMKGSFSSTFVKMFTCVQPEHACSHF